MISRAVLLSNWSELMLSEKNIHEEPELALLIYTVKQYSDTGKVKRQLVRRERNVIAVAKAFKCIQIN